MICFLLYSYLVDMVLDLPTEGFLISYGISA